MLDRLISGAGAVTDAADRAVRLLVGGYAMRRPGSIVVAGLLFVLAGILVAAGLEVTDPATPMALEPARVATARDLGDRTFSTVTGSLSTTWTETYEDANGNGLEDGDETGDAWFYWLVDPIGRRGVTVRSERSPAEIFTFHGRGLLIAAPKVLTEEYGPFDEEIARAGITVDPGVVVDTTIAAGEPVALGPAGPFPAPGTAVELTGPRTGGYLAVCSVDTDRNGRCDFDDQHQYEIVVFDPVTRHGLRVLVRQPPEFSDATVTGLLRREERAVDDAQTSLGFDFDELGLEVSDRYLLDDVVPPASAPLAYLLALFCLGLAGTILVGLAGGYLIYRRSAAALPVPGTRLAPGDRIPLRITGVLPTPAGREHVREGRADLVRVAVTPPPAPAADVPPDDDALPDDGPPLEPAPVGPITTALQVERAGQPQAIAIAADEVTRLSIGQVMAFRGPRPALRIVAGTGLLVLSFDTTGDRDRAAAELLDETGLGPDGTNRQPDT